MNHSFGLVIESLVAVLLMVTIGYCMLLNKRLHGLKADEQSLKATIGELITATEIAERAIGGLKLTVRDVNENLGEQLDGGDRYVASSSTQATGRRRRNAEPPVQDRHCRASGAAAPRAPLSRRRLSAAKATVAAAQAFAERSRASGIAA